MPEFTIGTRVFRTKTEAQAEIRRILNGVQLGDALTGADGQLIADLLYSGRHPEATGKIGNGIRHIVVRGASHGTRCFWIVHNDGTEADFSYVTAMNGRPSAKARVVAALRQEIRNQVSAYRERQPEDPPCVICRSPVDRTSAFVTYLDPTFDQLAEQFAADHGGWDAIPEVAVGPYGRQLEDRTLANEWQEVHGANAQLAIAHPQCNLTRPRRP